MIETDFYVVECEECKSEHLKCDVTKDGDLMVQIVIEPRFVRENISEKVSMFNTVLIDLEGIFDELSETKQKQ